MRFDHMPSEQGFCALNAPNPLPSATDGMTSLEARRLLERLFAHAVASVRGQRLIEARSRLEADSWVCDTADGTVEWDLPSDGRVIVIGAGKAVASLAKGLEVQFGERIDRGCIIVKDGHIEQLERIEQIEAGHPVPDERGVAGTRRLLEMLGGLTPLDRVFMLLTGGASALLVSPIDGVSLAEKAAVTNLLLRSQATIEEINAVRKALSQVKGGLLAEHIAPAQSMTLLLSDVPNGDLGTIGSGPTILEDGPSLDPLAIFAQHGLSGQVPRNVIESLRERRAVPFLAAHRPSARAETILLADSTAAVRAVDLEAARLGLSVVHVDLAMQGNTHDAARQFAATMKAHVAKGLSPPTLFVASGETTLLVEGVGRGGRNQEFALTAGRELAGEERLVLLASGTDGTDGPTEAAGAFADGLTCERAARAGLSVEEILANNDSFSLFQATGDLHITGPTGTNVMDLVLGMAF
jgi:glycerate 2-kinase